MRYIINRSGTVSLLTASFFAGCLTDKYILKRANAATAQLPATAVQPHILTGPTSTLDIDHVKEQPSRASQIMRYGYPGFDNLRTFEDYVLSYDRRNRIAHWVVEHLSSDRLVYNSSGSGYDRGHLAAAGNHRRSQTAIDQTFLLSNMAPQVGKGFNRDKWNELEKHVRKLARKNKNVYVCTGPLFLPKLEQDGSLYIKYKIVGRNNIAVPTHFFKVVLVELMNGKFELEAYILPNSVIPDDIPLTSFMVPLDSIERSAGFLIFDKLPKNALNKINGKSGNMLW
ncbi:endonuclease G, mitochondrial precursor, putative [Brugia malayi]|uniref:Endonuclease n=1 Tax=Brugia malayi TaxID=6279 RepID=A0A4E9FTA4_BRUMA|nr:endonuclease G, mitochondrial precursor, putative [Brugia malayi]VIO99750.1 endonuclease G, mitochondrial precursor, putative [Brugia malayi]